MRLRRPGADVWPRWIAAPLVSDWLRADELRPRSDPAWQLDRLTALCRMIPAAEEWCRVRRVDWRGLPTGFPRFPEEAPDVDPAEGGPPVELLALLLGRVSW